MTNNSTESPSVAFPLLTPGLLGLAMLILSPQAMAIPCDFKNGDVFNNICAYIEAGPVQTGGQLKVHVSTSRPNFDIHMRRAGNTNAYLQTFSFTNGVKYTAADNSYNGLNWGSGHTLQIPADWKSGIYELSFNNGVESYSEFVAIKSPQPGSYSKILLLDSLPTQIAYSPIGGKSFYGFNSTNGSAAHELSMERPTGRGQWSEHREFANWLDKKGIAFEAASMMDLQRDPALLNHYNLVVLIGHNEYWSKEMRDAWDSYLATGGNGAIFSGNNMWWQARFSSDGKHLICYKNDVTDPMFGVDNTRVTTLWNKSPINRPENLSTGVSFRNGGYHNYTEAGVPYYVKGSATDDGSYGGFKVADAAHWVFSGTNLSDGKVFGRGDGVTTRPIGGYEVDGTLFKMVNGKPVVTGEDATPTNFHILAYTPAYAVNSPSGIGGVVPNNYNGQGWGTMGIFKPSANSGTVFVAPTVSWAEGLNDPQVAKITENVINQLKTRSQQNMNGGSTNTSTPSSTSNTGTSNTGTTTDSSTSTTASSGGGGGSTTLFTLLAAGLGIWWGRKRQP